MTKTLRASIGAALLLSASAFAFAAMAQDVAAPAPAEPVAEAAPAAEPAPATEAAPVAPAAAATPTAVYSPGVLGKPAPGKGQVVFYRASKLMGAALSFKVREGEVELGKLSNGVYFVQDATPGLHEYVVHSEVKDVTTVEVEEGEVTYLAFSISIGVLAGRPNLSPSTQEAFEALKVKPSKWAPEAP